MVCEMDTLRTQKIRFLTGMYREMKLQMNEHMRLKFIENLIKILQADKSNKNVEEVIFKS